jgi:hypothetical protein
MTTSPLLGVQELVQGQADPYTTLNEAGRRRECLELRVLSTTTAAQPSSPAAGDAYIMPSGTLTGTDWATYAADDIAFTIDGTTWAKFTPLDGMMIGVAGGNPLYYESGTGWISIGGIGLPISDATALLKNASDATKLARFLLTAIATGTQVDLTLPGSSGTLARLADIPSGVGSTDLAYDSSSTTGLTYGYLAGRVRTSTTLIDVAAGTITLPASSTNYVEVDASGTVSSNTTGWTAGSIPLAIVPTSAGSIQTGNITDERAWLIVAGDLQSDGSVAMTGDFDLGAHNLKNFGEAVATAASAAIQVSGGTMRRYTMTAATTFTDSLAEGQSVMMLISGADTYTPTWPTGAIAMNTFPSTLDAVMAVEFVKIGGVLRYWYAGGAAS